MRLAHVIDPLAHRLLALRTVSGTQWTLRLLGAAALALALFAALGGAAVPGILTVVVTTAVAVSVLAQLLRPDSDLGLLGPAMIILSLLAHEDLSPLRAAAVGAALLGGHSAAALAATLPAHGVLERSAWTLAARSLLAVLALSGLGAAAVLALSGVQLGAWTVVPGVLAVIALFVAVLPPARSAPGGGGAPHP
ncbi:hypothetical protein [Brachybacterium sp. UNK5269]|uniref:hypothetical protein n=1 Tax=Brachybacterium sp. UNK5269 TaxID=3408576 RepID=UPI003BB18494